MDHEGEGGRREPQGDRQVKNRRRGRAGSGSVSGGKKPSEGMKASKQKKGRAFGQTGRRWQGSVNSQRKTGEGNTGK